MPKKTRTLGYVSLEFDGKTTQNLSATLLKDSGIKQEQYKTIKDDKHPAHVTLAFHTDPGFSLGFVETHYKDRIGKTFLVQIDGYVQDEHCAALVVNQEKDKFELPYLPPDKKLHVTMMHNKPAVYSNELLNSGIPITRFSSPLVIPATLKLNYVYV